MHPILANRNRLLAYLLAWIPVAALLSLLPGIEGGFAWVENAALIVPLCGIYAFVCLSPWYLCQVLPLSRENLPKLLLDQSAAAIAAGVLWTMSAKALSLLLARWFAGFDARFRRQLPVFFAIGVLIYLLAVALHYVLLSLQSSIDAKDREREANALAREAELKALKAQINPHFLFNSLNSISALTMSDPARAREMCVRLAEFLRSTLKLGDKEAIPLAEELALARTYLSVEQMRFGSRLQVQQSFPEKCASCPVPPLILQPLMENAVKHGIAGLLEGGTIRFAARCEHDVLRIHIENEFDSDAPASHPNGLGLANVRGRLRARFESRARLNTRVEGSRFSVEISMPCEEHARG